MSCLLFCAAPDGAGAVAVQQPVTDPPGTLQPRTEGQDLEDPFKMEGEKSPRGCAAENKQVSEAFPHPFVVIILFINVSCPTMVL